MIIKLIKPLSFVPAIFLMYMIFFFSAQDGTTSSALSYKVSYTIVETSDQILNLNMEPERISHIAERCEGMIRKLAHMTEYFALALAVSFPFCVYGLHGTLLLIVAAFICAAFACTDEFHQSFIMGRNPSVRDVAIDSIGILCGALLFFFIDRIRRRKIYRPLRRKKQQEKYDRQIYQSYGYQSYGNEEEPAARPFGKPEKVKNSETGKPRRNADSLSEDMSLKKLIRNLTGKEDSEMKNQK